MAEARVTKLTLALDSTQGCNSVKFTVKLLEPRVHDSFPERFRVVLGRPETVTPAGDFLALPDHQALVADGPQGLQLFCPTSHTRAEPNAQSALPQDRIPAAKAYLLLQCSI